MRNLHVIQNVPDVPEIVKLLLARWHIHSKNDKSRRFRYTKWENGVLYYNNFSVYGSDSRWEEVPIPYKKGKDRYGFWTLFKERSDIGIDCFNPDMLNMNPDA